MPDTMTPSEMAARILDIPGGGDSMPTGAIQAFMLTAAPTGWLACDGTQYAAADYPALFAALSAFDASIRSAWGSADWVNYFNVPDLRGEFLRGTGTNSHANQGSGENVGTHQDATEIPNYGADPNPQNTLHIYRNSPTEDNFSNHNNDFTIMSSENGNRTSVTGNNNSFSGPRMCRITTRPTNTSVLYCIKT